MNLEAVNRDPMLRRTPIGRVSLRARGRAIGVYADDGLRPPRCFAHLDERGLYAQLQGKAWWLQPAVIELYKRQVDAEKAAAAAELEARSQRRKRDLGKLLARDSNANEAMNIIIPRMGHR